MNLEDPSGVSRDVRHRTTTLRAVLLCLPLRFLAARGEDQQAAELPPEAASLSTGPLLLSTAGGIAAVEPSGGAVTFEALRAKASPDGSVVVRAMTRSDGTTRLTWLDPVDGHPTARAQMDAAATTRVVANDGRVALGPADVPLSGLVAPVPRQETAITVAGPDGEVRTYRVDGSVEPEAFSTDGSGLFVLSYTPPENPTEYQVNRLDLETGEIGGVYGQDSADERQERMGGTARTQVWAPDGSAVYTLYNQDVAGETTSFIHVLNLDEGWAFCLDLPMDIGAGSPAALAVSPDGARLWVTDAAGRGVVVDTEALEVVGSGEFPSPGPYGLVAVGDDDRVFLGSEDRITVLDGTDLSQLAQWRTSRPIIALRREDDRLVAVTDGQLTTFPLRAPETVPAGLDLPFTTSYPLIDPLLPYAECAC